jgi:chaperonin GroES
MVNESESTETVVGLPGIPEPLGRRILLKRIDPEEMSSGGLHIPAVAQENTQEAEVIMLGDGHDEDGEHQPFRLGVGDRVLLPKFGGTDFSYGGRDYLVIYEHEVLALLPIS